MLYYLFLVISVFLMGIQCLITKLYQKKIGGGIEESLIYSSVSGIISVLLFVALNGFKLHITSYSFIMACLVGLFFTFNNLLSIKIVSLGKISVYTLFNMLGSMLLPFLYGVLLLNENVNAFRWVALGFLILSLILQCFGKNEEKKSKVLFYILCVLVFLSNGVSGILTKIHQVNENASSNYDFLSVVYFMLFFYNLCALAVLYTSRKIKKQPISVIQKSGVAQGALLIFLYAIISGVSYMLQVFSAAHLPASVQYPILTGGTILITSLMSRIFFKEKLTKYIIIGIAIAFLATVLFIV